VLVASGPFDYNVIVTPGNYTVNVVSVDGCLSTSASYPYFPTAVENLTGIALSLYPNPANGYLFIAAGNEWKNYLIQVSDVRGNKIMEFKLASPNDQMDISSLDEGIYILSAQSGKGKFVQRFTVVH